MSIDWLKTPLSEFSWSSMEKQEDGTYTPRYPDGQGEAETLLSLVWGRVNGAYEKLIPYDLDEYGDLLEGYPEAAHCDDTGEVPVIRGGHRGYEALDSLTLADLPVILDTLVVLEEEYKQYQREEAERKAAARKHTDRLRAKERRKLKKLDLGEW